MEAGAKGTAAPTGGGAADAGPAIAVETARPLQLELLKRAIDVALSAALIIVCSPILCVLVLLVVLDSGRPVLYRQERIGRYGRVFSIWKFRTMVSSKVERRTDSATIDEYPTSVQRLVRLPKPVIDPRTTRIGRWLRIWSLDELPQLWNVLRGDMSLVGPRPLRRYEVESLEPWQYAVRQSVRPGMTGTWQVSGRSSVGWEERIALDCDYASASSPILDLKVLIGTLPAVLRRDGAR